MVSTRLHAHVARAIERRAPDAVADASTSSAAAPAATATTSAPVTTIPNDPTALIAVIAVLATIILGLVAWRIWAWRKRVAARKSAPSAEFAANGEKRSSGKESLFQLSSDTECGERPRTVVLDVKPADVSTMWVPQIQPISRPRVAEAPAPLEDTKEKEAEAARNSAPSIRTPPPAYMTGTVPTTRLLPPSPPAPPAVALPKPPAPAGLKLTSVFEPDTPAPATAAFASPSPARHASFAFQQQQFPPLTEELRRSTSSVSSSSSSSHASRATKLPRTMVVGHTFAPTLPDELTVAVGERVRMAEEYADGWCMVERGTSRGVVPRFCLVEREQRKSTVVAARATKTDSRRL